MPTASERSIVERDRWAAVAAAAATLADLDVAPVEAAVVALYDPGADLRRRAGLWGYPLASEDLADLARFAAALSSTEAEAWSADDPVTATRALEARRFLVADRVIHWAVPWLDQIGRCYPASRGPAHDARAVLLELGDEHRLAPAIVSGEGLFLPGEDSYGPESPDVPLAQLLTSLWSGGVLLDATLRSMTGDRNAGRAGLEILLSRPDLATDLAHLYRAYAARWRSLATAHPGTARLWSDLAQRANRTAARLSAGPG